MTALVLVGMSAADVDRRDELLRTARDLGATVAFLQMGDPTLSTELTRLADAGARSITLAGVSRGPLAPGQSWLRRIAARWWRERAGERPAIAVATRLAETTQDVGGVLARTRPITGGEPGLTSPAWEQVGAHRHQVMVCRGPRCTAGGSTETLHAMVVAAMEHGLGDEDVVIVHTGCQLPCNQAPVVSVQPDDVWYGRVDPAAARAIVADHLVRGQPVESHTLPRRAPVAVPPETR